MIGRGRGGLLAVLLLAACGGGADENVAPRAVDRALAPSSVAADRYRLFENDDDSTRDAFANAGPASLVDDGVVWEIRRADRLVGTLQISTLRADVDLTDADARASVVNDIIPGGGNRIAVAGQEVHTTTVADRTVYLWFGERLYQVLTLKGLDDDDQPEDVLGDVLTHQRTVPAWSPLPPDSR